MPFDLALGTTLIENGKIFWRKQVLQRMGEQNITCKEVKQVLTQGKAVQHFPTGRPFPRALFAMKTERPLHVMVAIDPEQERVYIIAVYQPDNNTFESDSKTRKK